MLTEDVYNMLLSRFLGKNPGKTERDYLDYELKRRYRSESANSNTKSEIRFFEIKLARLPKEVNQKETKNVSLPYQIALLDEIGFFDLDYFKHLSKEALYMVTSKLLNADPRSVKGNFMVLDPDSSENRMKYTANNHVDAVKKYLNQQK